MGKMQDSRGNRDFVISVTSEAQQIVRRSPRLMGLGGQVGLIKAFSARVERATCRLGGDRSIHLSYENTFNYFKRNRLLGGGKND